jgi:hypothetical protein
MTEIKGFLQSDQKMGRQLHPAAAGWRNDTVHPQVFDHLAVVVHEMGDAKGRHVSAA